MSFINALRRIQAEKKRRKELERIHRADTQEIDISELQALLGKSREQHERRAV